MKTLLVGDVSPTKDCNSYFAAKDIDALFSKEVQQLFVGNDINFVNLEVALTECEDGIEKFGPCLKASGGTADVLKQLGATVCGLANNHIFDFGKKGVADTFEHLARVGLPYTGYGENYEDSRKNYVVEKDGERVCLINVCEHEYSYALEDEQGARPFDCFDTIEDIRTAKETADRVIVLYHGGKEHSRYPSPRLVKTCRAMVRAGADVVLCQHTHIIGCYEQYQDGHILYGQGNFHFGGHENVEGWPQLFATLYDTKTHQIEFIPLENDGIKLHVMKGEKRAAELAAFEERNKKLADGSWYEGWVKFCHEKADWYPDAVGKAGREDSSEQANHRFAHYLDCEAHQDVLREYFKTAHQKKVNY